jgi:peptidoglycan/LPS O-acetylase OafA/YrhL
VKGFARALCIPLLLATLALQPAACSVVQQPGFKTCFLLTTASLVFFFIFNKACTNFFSNKISTYLGKISFSIYLIHIAVFLVVAPRIYSGQNYTFTADMIILIVCIGTAHFFYFFDVLGQKFSTMLAQKIMGFFQVNT